MQVISAGDIPYEVWNDLFAQLIAKEIKIRSKVGGAEIYATMTTEEIFTDIMVMNEYFMMVGDGIMFSIVDLQKYEQALLHIASGSGIDSGFSKGHIYVWRHMNGGAIATAVYNLLMKIPPENMLELIRAIKLVRQFRCTALTVNAESMHTQQSGAGKRTWLKMWIIICRICNSVVLAGNKNIWSLHIQLHHFPLGSSVTPSVNSTYMDPNLASYICNSRPHASKIKSTAKWITNLKGDKNKYNEPEADKECLICGETYENMTNKDLEAIAGCRYRTYALYGKQAPKPVFNPFKEIVLSHLFTSHGDMDRVGGKFASVWKEAESIHDASIKEYGLKEVWNDFKHLRFNRRARKMIAESSDDESSDESEEHSEDDERDDEDMDDDSEEDNEDDNDD